MPFTPLPPLLVLANALIEDGLAERDEQIADRKAWETNPARHCRCQADGPECGSCLQYAVALEQLGAATGRRETQHKIIRRQEAFLAPELVSLAYDAAETILAEGAVGISARAA